MKEDSIFKKAGNYFFEAETYINHTRQKYLLVSMFVILIF